MTNVLHLEALIYSKLFFVFHLGLKRSQKYQSYTISEHQDAVNICWKWRLDKYVHWRCVALLNSESAASNK